MAIDDTAVVPAVFSYVMGRNANFQEFNDRLRTHKIVYLLGELGVSCGDYSFRWHMYGPYSQRLQDTMLKARGEGGQPVALSDLAKQYLGIIKNVLMQEQGDETEQLHWLEAVGSLHYLCKYVKPVASDENVLKELQDRKPHLKDSTLNRKALETLREHKLLA